MIPAVIYFTFGLVSDFGDRPFTLAHYLAVKSAKLVNDFPVFLYYQYEPKNNIWWEETKQYCTLVPYEPVTEFFGNEMSHPAYKADVFRLVTLNQTGGIYLDMDSICIRSFRSFLSHSFVMGKEITDQSPIGLCNACMMGEPGSRFSQKWIEAYQKSYDHRWGYMQVHYPYILSKANPDIIHIEPSGSFFRYNWTEDGLKKVHEQVNDMDGAYSLHLWEQRSYHPYLAPLTIDYIKTVDTTYTLLARKFL